MNENIILNCTRLSGNIGILTKNYNTPSHASKLAFFVPKINQAWLGLQRFGAKYRNHISKYERVKGRIQEPVTVKKTKRVVAFSNTRSPEFKTGGLLTRNYNGGQTMPLITSNRLTAFTFSVNLPDDSFIETVSAMYSAGDWLAYITTTRDQHAPICNTQGKPLRFATLDSLAHYLADAGLCEFDVSLLGLKGVA
ncbi:hypothetical protein JX580_02330 [Thiomicrospira microaerophila]|uniref:hypothetical protein n=1 Tax=Thiomicrospira microaerophila TaxID=406020 RepID=UPI00200C9633|nr:hypothetical protein [Thiomicrospira microaerophila]UQB42755.1 hypothetical protein JX580_02330 [Thiomicrospira microaerophila]